MEVSGRPEGPPGGGPGSVTQLPSRLQAGTSSHTSLAYNQGTQPILGPEECVGALDTAGLAPLLPTDDDTTVTLTATEIGHNADAGGHRVSAGASSEASSSGVMFQVARGVEVHAHPSVPPLWRGSAGPPRRTTLPGPVAEGPGLSGTAEDPIMQSRRACNFSLDPGDGLPCLQQHSHSSGSRWGQRLPQLAADTARISEDVTGRMVCRRAFDDKRPQLQGEGGAATGGFNELLRSRQARPWTWAGLRLNGAMHGPLHGPCTVNSSGEKMTGAMPGGWFTRRNGHLRLNAKAGAATGGVRACTEAPSHQPQPVAEGACMMLPPPPQPLELHPICAELSTSRTLGTSSSIGQLRQFLGGLASPTGSSTSISDVLSTPRSMDGDNTMHECDTAGACRSISEPPRLGLGNVWHSAVPGRKPSTVRRAMSVHLDCNLDKCRQERLGIPIVAERCTAQRKPGRVQSLGARFRLALPGGLAEGLRRTVSLRMDIRPDRERLDISRAAPQQQVLSHPISLDEGVSESQPEVGPQRQRLAGPVAEGSKASRSSELFTSPGSPSSPILEAVSPRDVQPLGTPSGVGPTAESAAGASSQLELQAPQERRSPRSRREGSPSPQHQARTSPQRRPDLARPLATSPRQQDSASPWDATSPRQQAGQGTPVRSVVAAIRGSVARIAADTGKRASHTRAERTATGHDAFIQGLSMAGAAPRRPRTLASGEPRARLTVLPLSRPQTTGSVPPPRKTPAAPSGTASHIEDLLRTAVTAIKRKSSSTATPRVQSSGSHQSSAGPSAPTPRLDLGPLSAEHREKARAARARLGDFKARPVVSPGRSGDVPPLYPHAVPRLPTAADPPQGWGGRARLPAAPEQSAIIFNTPPSSRRPPRSPPLSHASSFSDASGSQLRPDPVSLAASLTSLHSSLMGSFNETNRRSVASRSSRDSAQEDPFQIGRPLSPEEIASGESQLIGLEKPPDRHIFSPRDHPVSDRLRHPGEGALASAMLKGPRSAPPWLQAPSNAAMGRPREAAPAPRDPPPLQRRSSRKQRHRALQQTERDAKLLRQAVADSWEQPQSDGAEAAAVAAGRVTSPHRRRGPTGKAVAGHRLEKGGRGEDGGDPDSLQLQESYVSPERSQPLLPQASPPRIPLHLQPQLQPQPRAPRGEGRGAAAKMEAPFTIDNLPVGLEQGAEGIEVFPGGIEDMHDVFRPAQASVRRTKQRALPPSRSRHPHRRHAVALECPAPAAALDIPPRRVAPAVVHDDPDTPGRLLAAAESERRAKLRNQGTWAHYSSQFHPVVRRAGPASEPPSQDTGQHAAGWTPPPVPLSANTGEYHHSWAFWSPHALEAQGPLHEGQQSQTLEVAAAAAAASMPPPEPPSPRASTAARRASAGSAAMTASPASSPLSSPSRPVRSTTRQRPPPGEIESQSESTSASAPGLHYPAAHSGPPSSRGVIGATLGSWVQEGGPIPQRRSAAFSDEPQPSSAGDVSLDIMRAGLLAGADLQSIDYGPHHDAAAYGLPPPPHLRSPSGPTQPDQLGLHPFDAAVVAAGASRPIAQESPARSSSTPTGTSAAGMSTATAMSAMSAVGQGVSGTSGTAQQEPPRLPADAELASTPRSAKSSDIMARALGAFPGRLTVRRNPSLCLCVCFRTCAAPPTGKHFLISEPQPNGDLYWASIDVMSPTSAL
jgi:hypothetical protein